MILTWLICVWFREKNITILGYCCFTTNRDISMTIATLNFIEMALHFRLAFPSSIVIMICVYWKCVCWNEHLTIRLIMRLCSIMCALMSEFYLKVWNNLCFLEKCYTNKVAGLEFPTCLCLRSRAFLVSQMTVWPPQTTKTALPWTPDSYSGEENKSKIKTIQNT